MKVLAHVEDALNAYAEWRNAPAFEYWNAPSRFASIQENGPCAAPIGSGSGRVSDGGMLAFVREHEQQLELERVARGIYEALAFLPPDFVAVFEATYVGPPREIPRSERDAAARMHVSQSKYRMLKFGMMAWFAGRNAVAMPAKINGRKRK